MRFVLFPEAALQTTVLWHLLPYMYKCTANTEGRLMLKGTMSHLMYVHVLNLAAGWFFRGISEDIRISCEGLHCSHNNHISGILLRHIVHIFCLECSNLCKWILYKYRLCRRGTRFWYQKHSGFCFCFYCSWSRCRLYMSGFMKVNRKKKVECTGGNVVKT